MSEVLKLLSNLSKTLVGFSSSVGPYHVKDFQASMPLGPWRKTIFHTDLFSSHVGQTWLELRMLGILVRSLWHPNSWTVVEEIIFPLHVHGLVSNANMVLKFMKNSKSKNGLVMRQKVFKCLLTVCV